MKAVGEAALRRLIAERVAAWNDMPVGSVPMDRPLADLGMSSRDAVALAGELSYLLGRELPSTLLWETPTGDALVARLCGEAEEVAPVAVDDRSAPGRPGGPGENYEPVAVVGVGCRLPGAVHGPADYWRLLDEGTDAIRRVPEDRWRDFTPFPPADVPPYGGYLDDIAGFDADFFHITPREAAVMDPQQRILLEVVHEALAHAAVPAASLAGSATGVFVGISAPEYGQLTGADPSAVDPWAPAGAALSVAAGRLSYVLDTRGPSMAVDTACSSSLVAVHHACVSLRTGESDTAIAAGVNLLLSPTVTMAFQRAGALAPDGRCKPFSAAADGIGRGEGCAAVLLKRLSDAERDGDRVLAVIRATAVNSDGRSGGLMAPNPAAQRAVLSTAYARAGLAASSVDYVEAHGTGTPLGDPIEAGALDSVLGRDRDPDQPLLVGSVKGNLGHLESAAGVAGLVKTVLALHHDRLPPSLHCADGSALGDARLRVVTEAEPWPRYGGTATAGVSGFGFGGTNAHAVLEEWRPGALVPDAGGEPVAHLFPLSDVDAERVRDTAARLADWLHTPNGGTARLADLARTLAGRTGRGRARAAVTARDRAELADALGALARQRPHTRVVTDERDLVGRGPVWVFSGYGSQWAGMGRRLLAEEPAFAAAVEKLDPQLAAECGLSLYDHLATGGDLDRLEVAQPVLFGLQVALAELWRSRGVEPVAVIGHSLGEVAAAVCAGALDVPDAARIVAVRARLLSGLSGGAMAVVDVPDDELDGLRRDFPGVHVAVHSSPRQKVVTGQEPDVAAFVRRLEERGRAARVMRVVGAGHSPQVDALLPELTEALAGLRGRPPRVPVYSTVLDDPRGESRFDAAHWAANLRRPVRLDRAVAAAAEDGHTAFVEISPTRSSGRPSRTPSRTRSSSAPCAGAPTTRPRSPRSSAPCTPRGCGCPCRPAGWSTCPLRAGGMCGTGGRTASVTVVPSRPARRLRRLRRGSRRRPALALASVPAPALIPSWIVCAITSPASRATRRRASRPARRGRISAWTRSWRSGSVRPCSASSGSNCRCAICSPLRPSRRRPTGSGASSRPRCHPRRCPGRLLRLLRRFLRRPLRRKTTPRCGCCAAPVLGLPSSSSTRPAARPTSTGGSPNGSGTTGRCTGWSDRRRRARWRTRHAGVPRPSPPRIPTAPVCWAVGPSAASSPRRPHGS